MTDSHADYNEIILDSMRFRVIGDMLNVQELAKYAPKQIFGDATKDSHRYFSSWILDDLSGGHGVAKLLGTTNNRYRFGTINTRYPSQWTLPFQAHLVEGPNTDGCRVLGDLDGDFYLSYGTALYIWDETTDTVSAATGSPITAIPVNKPVTFQGTAGSVYLFLPLGSSGVDKYDGTTVTNYAASGTVPAAQALLVWDNKLFAVDTSGQIWHTLDGTTWASDGAEAKLDGSYTPRHLLNYFDRTGVATPYLVTNRDVWALDDSGPVLYRTELTYPPAASQGMGAANWRGDLYTSVGMGVFRYNGAIVAAMGLDRDQGLPATIRGKIVDLCNEFNGLYALCAGAENITDADEEFLFDVFDDELYFNATTTVSSLHVWTSFGWLNVWLAAEDGGTPSWVVVSDADDTHRLWWGVGGSAYTMKIPVDFTNPQSIIEAGEGDFAEFGYLDSGRFSADMIAYAKIANAVEVQAKYLEASGGRIDVQYDIDGSGMWQVLGSVTTDGTTVLPFGAEDAYGTTQGVEFKEIELRVLILQGTDATTSPLIDHVALTFLKVESSTLDWTAQLDLSAPYAGNSPEVMAAKIDELITSKRFFTMLHRNVPYRVRIASWTGGEETGFDTRGNRTINILQMKEQA